MREVLLGVLEEYVETARPVASVSVARRSASAVSSATVRAAMAELTELGLLTQPHPSAGRVPSDRAFRLYVDHLMTLDVWRDAVPSGVGRDLARAAGGVEDTMRRAADLVADVTGQLGFSFTLAVDRIRLRHVHFVRVSSERVTALLVTERGGFETRVIEECDSDQRTLDDASARLSGLVSGCTLTEARARLLSTIERERERSDALWRRTFALGRAGLVSQPMAELYVSDVNLLLSHPEFTDVHRLRQVLGALEEKERIMKLLDKIVKADVFRVVIGSELEDPNIQECAVVTAPLGNLPLSGGLGVIGPVRMRYDRVIPIVRYVSEQIANCIA